MPSTSSPICSRFLAVSLLASHIDFGTDLPTFPVLTGPGIVDASNIDATLAGVTTGRPLSRGIVRPAPARGPDHHAPCPVTRTGGSPCPAFLLGGLLRRPEAGAFLGLSPS